MTHRFKLIKGKEEYDLDPELFNHVDGREVIGVVKSKGYFLMAFCKSRTGHYWKEVHYDDEREAFENYRSFATGDDTRFGFKILLDEQKAFPVMYREMN